MNRGNFTPAVVRSLLKSISKIEQECQEKLLKISESNKQEGTLTELYIGARFERDAEICKLYDIAGLSPPGDREYNTMVAWVVSER